MLFFSYCLFLKALLLLRYLSCMLLLSEPPPGGASSPETSSPSPASHHAPSPFQCGSAVSASLALTLISLSKKWWGWARKIPHKYRIGPECWIDLYFSRQLDMTLLVSWNHALEISYLFFKIQGSWGERLPQRKKINKVDLRIREQSF